MSTREVPLKDRKTLTTAEAAELTGLSKDTIARARKAGDLPAKRVGSRVLIRHVDLDAWLDSLEDY